MAEGVEPLGVVGESNYQEALRRLAGACSARRTPEVRHTAFFILVPEEGNPYDANAVSVWAGGQRVGYLSREDAERYRPGLIAAMGREGQPIALAGVIAGGGVGDDGRARMLGVFLRHDPTFFGLPPMSTPRQSSVRSGRGVQTGESVVAVTDDDSRGLGWADRLPDDTGRRIPKLRKLLASETDPVDRHFMMNMLEGDLYKSRGAFPAALVEFDEVCEQHHAEMVAGIRDALLREFGDIPLLSVYKQAAIRWQKAHDFAKALDWAERGLAVYGSQAHRSEDIADLENRVAKYRLGRAATPHPRA